MRKIVDFISSFVTYVTIGEYNTTATSKLGGGVKRDALHERLER